MDEQMKTAATKSRRERRAEAVERLEKLGERKGAASVLGIVLTDALYDGDNNRYMESDANEDRLIFIDLLSEDECHNTLDDDWGTFECSECGTQWEVSPVYIDAGGTSEHDLIIPRHCPNCGCKVVEE